MSRIYLNEGWSFTGEFREELLGADCGEEGLEQVRLPHTVTETPFSYFDESVYQLVSGYRRELFVPEEWRGKRLLLTFEGVAHDSLVYCNGKPVGEHHCGYTAFTLDITETAEYGKENILAVRVDSRENLNTPPFGYVIDYMTYGGIYRDVYLEVKEQSYIGDVFHYCEFMQNCISAEGDTAAGVTLVTSYEVECSVKHRELMIKLFMKDQEGGEKELWHAAVTGNNVGAGNAEEKHAEEKSVEENLAKERMSGKCTAELRVELEEVKLWSAERPVLYTLISRLYEGETLLDEREVPFGFRKAEFRADGFYLNDVKTKLRGLNRHQSYPYVGYAMPRSMQELDAVILKKELGVNAVRTSHYPQSHHFLHKCDEIGLLVFTEIPGWQHIGDKEWKEQAVRNTEDMVKEYRNHPSIILWGVRINESQDDDEFYKRTNEAAHRLDPSRQTGGVRAHKKSSLLEDVYTYNDFVHDGEARGCEPKKKVTSDMTKGYLVSEYNGHMYPTKAYDAEEHRREHAIRHAAVLNAVAGEADIAGSFGWCMFDYNTHKDFGSGDRICYHGVLDMFRNPKDAACIYACQQEEETILALSSTMDIGEHPGCNRGILWIYSNADSVRMYKNDRFIKEYFPKESPFGNLKHGPVALDDFIGNAIAEEENFKPNQAEAVKKILNAVALYGLGGQLPKRVYLTALKLLLVYHMKVEDVVTLYNKYIGNWGGASTVYRFEAVKNGSVVKELVKEPVRSISLKCVADHTELEERVSYDVALVQIRAVDQNGNVLPFFNEPVQ
ncbi:MAG: glycoside hydrolase family 2 TIM barrel-domain containing protein, partial [Acetatifactor sp.]